MVNQKKRAIALMMLVSRAHVSLLIAHSGHQFGRGVGALAEAHQRLGEGRIGMHRNVARDVVEDVRFGQVVQLVGCADGDGGGELAVAQAVEKQERGNIAAHRLGLKSGQRAQKSIDVVKLRHTVRIEA